MAHHLEMIYTYIPPVYYQNISKEDVSYRVPKVELREITETVSITKQAPDPMTGITSS